jgi:hypothetical protein
VVGGGALVYYPLKPWVDLKNGRKIRIKTAGMEVEATQLSEEQFLKLLPMIEDREKKKGEVSLNIGLKESRKTRKRLDGVMITRLRSEGLALRSPESLDYSDEKTRLSKLLTKSRTAVEDRLSGVGWQ